MAAEDPRAVDQQISLTAFQIQQALFIVTALRLARLSVNISYDALDHVNLKSRKETRPHNTIRTQLDAFGE